MHGTVSQDMNFHASRVAALDGIRGIAILLVFAVHTTPALLLGGRIGVDLFFVLSGFLITSILLQEQRQTGSIHLGYFYMRRVLRLYPALVTVVLFVMAYVWIKQTPAQFDRTLYNAVGVLAYFFNWQLVWEFPNYLNHQWMFSHVWSLSVEEQFYIFWPLIILTLFAVRAPVCLKFGVVVAGITLPAIARAILWHRDPSLSIYFQSHLRLDGLMWGAFAAMLIDARIFPTGTAQKLVSLSAFAALAALFYVATFEGLTNGFLYLIGFSLVEFFSAFLIYASVVCPQPLLNHALTFVPLRWVGKISYGLYLWHWPIIRAVSDMKLAPLSSMLLEFSLTFAVATFSFYCMERWFLGLKRHFVTRSRSVACDGTKRA